MELGVQRLTGAVTTTKIVFGGGPSYEGSTFEGWNQGKPFLVFSRFLAGSALLILLNFLGTLEWANQGVKSGNNVVLEQQCSVLEELVIAAVGLSGIHYLVLVAYH